MEEDRGSTATMTSVTEDLSLGSESDTSTHSINTSSQLTSSEATEGGRNTDGNVTQLYEPVADKETKAVTEANVNEVCEEEEEEGEEEEDERINTSTNTDKRTPPHPQGRQSGQGGSTTQPESSRPRLPWGSGMYQAPDVTTVQGQWYEHECFNHYWRHYHYVSLWCRKHMETYRTVLEQYNRAMAQQQTQPARRRQASPSQPAQPTFKKPVSKKTLRNRKARRRHKLAKKRHKMEQRSGSEAGLDVSGSCGSPSVSSDIDQTVGDGVTGETTESALEGAEGEVDADVEITDEMLDFFAHTHKHRQERDASKKDKDNEKEEKLVNIEDEDQGERTELAPTERVGSRRRSEMQQLYGQGAAMIHGMETALQVTFDRHLDIHQPSLWPNMPLRITF